VIDRSRQKQARAADRAAAFSPEEALGLLRKGRAPEGMRVDGPLSLAKETKRLELPAGLEVPQLDCQGYTHLETLPPGLKVVRLIVDDCERLTELPADLACFELAARRSGLRHIPAGVAIEYKLALAQCRNLVSLPENLRTGSLELSGCTALERLPEGLDVQFLDIRGCTNLAAWPARGRLTTGRLDMRGCAQFDMLPDWIGPLNQVDLAECRSLARLPRSLVVTGWIDVGGTAIRELPEGCADAALRWRGVTVDERIAFHPETITVPEILAEENAERRRVMLERVGYERFMHEGGAQVRHTDRDPGGARQLLVVPLEGDEDLVCLAVSCPSTERRYVIRVPPAMTTCHQAAAWIAGFDDPKAYKPLVET
jgi:hypothetical protein